MPVFTKKAIVQSLFRLLNERPLSKITVKDIVEDCGITRNTFYYHFHDVPELIEQAITEEMDDIMAAYANEYTAREGVENIVSQLMMNKAALNHIWGSSNRERLEVQLMRICGSFADKCVSNSDRFTGIVDDRHKKALVEILQCECFGQIVKWFNDGMKDDLIEHFNVAEEMYNAGLIRIAK